MSETRVLALGGFPFISFVGAYYFLFHGVISSYVGANVAHLPFPREISYETFAYSAAFAGAAIAGLVLELDFFWRVILFYNLGVGRDQMRSASCYRPDCVEYSFFVLCVSVLLRYRACRSSRPAGRFRDTLVLGVVR